MNSMLRAGLGALVRLLAPETTGASSTDRTFAEQQYVTPAWEHGHVPMSVDLFGAFGRTLDARDPLQR